MKVQKDPIKLVVFPKDSNPYQDLLYGPIADQVEITYLNPVMNSVFSQITIIASVAFNLSRLRLSGHRLIHIHWVYPFYVSRQMPFNKQLTYLYISIFLKLLSVLRFKVIWTVHNVVPQNPVSNNDQKLMQKLSILADYKIVHAKAVLTQMKALNISTKNANVIPVGSYQGIYPDNITSKSARKKLGIAEDEFVILFFGIISQYKGVEDLVTAFETLELPNARLLIVGSCREKGLLSSLKESTRHAKIDLYEGHVPDKEVAIYFKACNVVCLPFRNITTSSSVMLAQAFAKPVIAPRLGALNDLPYNVGFLYEADNPKSLANSLRLAANNLKNLSKLGINGKAYSDNFSWDKIASQTEDIYAKVANL